MYYGCGPPGWIFSPGASAGESPPPVKLKFFTGNCQLWVSPAFPPGSKQRLLSYHKMSLLLHVAKELNRRCLRIGAKWALELYGTMAKDLPVGLEGVTVGQVPLSCAFGDEEEGLHELARVYIAGKEFARAAHLLDGRYMSGSSADPSAYPPLAFFLRCYALYLVRAYCFAPGGVGGFAYKRAVQLSTHPTLPHSPTPHAHTTPLPAFSCSFYTRGRTESAGASLNAQRALQMCSWPAQSRAAWRGTCLPCRGRCSST
jgi:hypothetical protein